MENTEVMSRSRHYDAMSDEIKTRKSEIGTARHLASLQDKYTKGPGATASSKLRAYQAGSNAMRTFNRSTEQLLVSPKMPSEPNGRAGFSPPSGVTLDQVALGGARNGSRHAQKDRDSAPGDAGREVSSSAVFSNRGDSPGEVIMKLTKTNRTLAAKAKMLQEELERYKDGLANVTDDVDDIDNESMATNQQVADLADDLQTERRNHETARRNLDLKTREVEEQAARLAELEEASNAVHEENLGLCARINELNRVADEQQQQRQADEAAEAAAAARDARGEGGFGDDAGAGDGSGTEGGPVSEELMNLQTKLEKLERAMELKTRENEAVKIRAAKDARELQQFRGQARSGRLKRFLWGAVSLARVVGFLGFMFFVYLALSEDALRSRGVDVYRLTL